MPPTLLAFLIGTTPDELKLRAIKETLRRTKVDESLAEQFLGMSARTTHRKLNGFEAAVASAPGVNPALQPGEPP